MLNTVREAWVDFISVPSLTRRAGAPEHMLSLVAAKELIDNALDASPAGVDVSVGDRSVTVADAGPGLSEDAILNIFCITRPSFSSKRWRLARRGALGNGTRAVLGIAYISGGYIEVASRGLMLRLSLNGDGSTKVLARETSDVSTGTTIAVHFGDRIAFSANKIRQYAILCTESAGKAYGGTKAVPSWFTAEGIKTLVRDMPANTSVLDFARNFDITDDAVASIKTAGMRRSTTDMLNDDALLSLVTGMLFDGQKSPRELKPMGRNGRHGAYAISEGTFTLGGAEMPCVVEVWITGQPVHDRKTSGEVTLSAVYANRTPALMAANTAGHVNATTKTFVLIAGNRRYPLPNLLKGPCSFTVELAITAPELPIVSDGKAIDIEAFADNVFDVLTKALPKAYRAPMNAIERGQTSKATSIKDAIYSMIAGVYDGISSAGIGVPPRMLMYRCRRDILLMTGREDFNYTTFVNALHDFMDDYPDLTKDWQILYDDRGHFILPGGESIGLGTQAVTDFIADLDAGSTGFQPNVGSLRIEVGDAGSLHLGNNPAHRYSAVIFVEKEGYNELLRNARIAQRFDVALCSTKGLPNTSIRRLLDTLATYGVKVFCLHDFDVAGMTIANTLANSNRRYEFTNRLDFVDMGVRLADAIELGLESEPFKLDSRKDVDKLKDRLRSYGATEAEITMLVDDKQRIEIDAMTPAQLIAFIERKLVENGIKKIVPAQEDMAPVYEAAVFRARLDRELAPLRERLTQELEAFAAEQRGNLDLLVEAPNLQLSVNEYLSTHRQATWIDAINAIAADHEKERA